MAQKLPVISGKVFIKIISKKGFKMVHRKGSHVYLTDGSHKISVPLHSELKKGLLINLINQAGLTREDFMELYHKTK